MELQSNNAEDGYKHAVIIPVIASSKPQSVLVLEQHKSGADDHHLEPHLFLRLYPETRLEAILKVIRKKSKAVTLKIEIVQKILNYLESVARCGLVSTWVILA